MRCVVAAGVPHSYALKSVSAVVSDRQCSTINDQEQSENLETRNSRVGFSETRDVGTVFRRICSHLFRRVEVLNGNELGAAACASTMSAPARPLSSCAKFRRSKTAFGNLIFERGSCKN